MRYYSRALRAILFLTLSILPPLGAEEHALGVLYFETVAGGGSLSPEDRGALSAALTEMTISDLSALSALSLVDRENLNRIMEEQKLALSGLIDEGTAVQAGKLLGVTYLFSGKLAFTGSLATITGRITEVETGRMVASVSRNGPADRLFSLREDMVEELVYRWDIPLSPGEREALAVREEISLEGVLNLGKALRASDSGDYDGALTYLARAVELNPDFTLAAGLAGEIGKRFDGYLERRDSDLPGEILAAVDALARREEGSEQRFSQMYWAYLQPLLMGMSYYGSFNGVDESIRESYFADYIRPQWAQMGLAEEPATAEELEAVLGRKLYRAYGIVEYLLEQDLPRTGYNAYLHPVEGAMGYFLTLFAMLPSSPDWALPPMRDGEDRVVMGREQLFAVLLSYCDMFLTNFPYSSYNGMVTPLMHFLLSEKSG